MLAEAATLSSVSFYGTLLWQAYQVHRQATVEGGQVHSCLSAYFNAAMWCKYGMLSGDGTVFAVNAVGMAASMALLTVLYINTADKGGMERVLWRSLSVFAGFAYAVYRGWLQVQAVGRCAALLSVFVFLTPIVSATRQLRLSRFPDLTNQNCNNTNGTALTAVAGVVSCGLWSAYGVTRSDQWIIIPNVIGVLLSGTQLYLFLLARHRAQSYHHQKASLDNIVRQ